MSLRTRAPFLLLLLFLGSCAQSQAHYLPRPGVQDLRNVDLARVRELDGPWELYWRRLLLPADFVSGQSWPCTQLSSQVQWTRLRDRYGRRYPDTGFATYRLRILVDTSKVRQLAFSLKESGSAYRLWVDGLLAFSNGRVGRSLGEEVPENAFRTAVAPLRGPEVELVFQTSNFHANNGGLDFPIRVGTPEAIQRHLFLHFLLQAMVMGMFLLLGIQQAANWIGSSNRRFRAPALVFSLYCFVWIAEIATESGEMRLLTLVTSAVSFEALNRINSLCLFMFLLLTSLFTQLLFPFRHLKVTSIVLWAYCGAMAVAICLLPFRACLPWIWWATWIICAGLISVVCACILAARQGRPYAACLAVGYLVYLAVCVNDTLRFLGMSEAPYLLTYGSAVLAICQALILSSRTNSALRANAELVAEAQLQNRELQRLSKVKDAFLANTSHELRTPLHGILGLTQAVLADVRTELACDMRRSLEVVVVSARRLSGLVDALLDTASLTEGEMKLHLSVLSLAGLGSELLVSLRPLAEQKGVSLELRCEPGLPRVRGDADRIAQVLVNLLGNALRFTERGRVELVLSTMERRVLLEVRDTGRGIAPVDLERIFGRFEQVGDGRGGTGLGLAISRELVRLHGSELRVESQEGKGSRFFFDLEAVTEVSQESVADAVPLPVPEICPIAPEPDDKLTSRKFRCRVLAVDDEPINLRVVQAFLEPQGIEVLCATSGLEALERIAAEVPALVLLDVMMPEMDGLAVCRRLRERYSASELPVLFLSARAFPEDVARGFAVGGNDYVPKPFLREVLLSRVELQLRLREAYLESCEDALRARICVLLNRSLELWCAATGGTKPDLADASGLWKVHADRNGWRRAVTLDRYLELHKWPKNPKWRLLERTVEFVAESLGKEQGEALLKELESLRHLLAHPRSEIAESLDES